MKQELKFSSCHWGSGDEAAESCTSHEDDMKLWNLFGEPVGEPKDLSFYIMKPSCTENVTYTCKQLYKN